MPKLPVVKTKELVDVLMKLEFLQAKAKGTSHRVFKHIDGRRTTVSIHGNSEIPRGTLLGILSDLNISKDEFISLIKN
ncbi:addiction module toxin, HicA family [bacterium]|nr:MAG: addiction module toxin, HicA family [bacterium]